MGDQTAELTETIVENGSARFVELGLAPTSQLAIVPSNFLTAANQRELYFVPATSDFKVLLRQAGLTPAKVTPEGVRIPFRDDRDRTLILPVLFLGATFLAENSHLISVALGVLANYVTDFFKGKAGVNKVDCKVLIETTDKKTIRTFDFKGPPESFDKLIEAVKKALS